MRLDTFRIGLLVAFLVALCAPTAALAAGSKTTPASTTTTPAVTTPTATTPASTTTPTTTTPTTTTPTVTLPTVTNTLTTPTGTATVIAATGATMITTATGATKKVPIVPPEVTAPVTTDTTVEPYSSGIPPKEALATDGQNDRFLMDGTWLYAPDPADAGLSQDWESPTTSTSTWTPVNVPNSFNAGNLSTDSFYGSVGWYRRDFTLPTHAFPGYVPASAQSWIIDFESVNYDATVWLNGHELGQHGGANLPFEFTIPTRDLVAGVNTLVVRVSDELTANDFPPRNPGGGWWNFGGILDGVYLRPVAEADIDSFSVQTPIQSPTGSATIEAQAGIRNVSNQAQTVTLTGTYGPASLNFGTATIPAGATWQASADATLQTPQLWAPGSPTLYQATLSLTDSKGRPLSSYSYESGIRTISVSNGLLYLNGRQLSLRGVNLHEQTVASGAALSVAQQAQLIDWVKQLDATIIRAHYPLDQEMEQMADEDGILLWSEVPVYHPGNAQLADPTWRASAVSLLQDNIVTNEAHPSILLWSVGNELGSPPQPGQSTYIAQAAAAVHELDPSRPAAIAITDWPGLPCQSEYKPLDVVGVNAYFDWFDSGGGTTDDRNQLSSFLDSVHNCYPTKALFVSEFGFGGNRDGPTEVRGTYEYQSNSLAFNLGVFASKSWLAGAMYFPLQDFAASPGFDGSDPLGTPPYVDKGVLDQYGNEKPAFQVMQQLYSQQLQISAPLRRAAAGPRPRQKPSKAGATARAKPSKRRVASKR